MKCVSWAIFVVFLIRYGVCRRKWNGNIWCAPQGWVMRNENGKAYTVNWLLSWHYKLKIRGWHSQSSLLYGYLLHLTRFLLNTENVVPFIMCKVLILTVCPLPVKGSTVIITQNTFWQMLGKKKKRRKSGGKYIISLFHWKEKKLIPQDFEHFNKTN